MELRSSKVKETPFTSNRVFNMPEILENLLKYLDTPSLLAKRSVCKLWNSEATKILTSRNCGATILDYKARIHPPRSWGWRNRKLFYQSEPNLAHEKHFKKLSKLFDNSINPQILISYLNFQLYEKQDTNLQQQPTTTYLEPKTYQFYEEYGSQTKCTINIQIYYNTHVQEAFLFSFLQKFPHMKSLTLNFKRKSDFSNLKSSFENSLDFKSLRSFELILDIDIEKKLLNLFTQILISTPQLKVLKVKGSNIPDLFQPILKDPKLFKSVKYVKDLALCDVKHFESESKDEECSRNENLVKILNLFSESIQSLKFIPGGSNIFPISLFPRMKNLKTLHTVEDLTDPFYNDLQFTIKFPKLNTFLVQQSRFYSQLHYSFYGMVYDWPISIETSLLSLIKWEDIVKHACSQRDHLNVLFVGPFCSTINFDIMLDNGLSKLNPKSLFYEMGLHTKDLKFIKHVFETSLQKITSLEHCAMLLSYPPTWLEEKNPGWTRNWDGRALLASKMDCSICMQPE